MGRPKGSKNKSVVAKTKIENKKAAVNNTTNVVNTTETIDSTETIEAKKIPKVDPKLITAKYECELCGEPIYDSPRIIRCTELTGFALYHRSIQDQYKVCNECGKEFNDVVEKWLIKKGAKLRAGYINKNIDKKDKD